MNKKLLACAAALLFWAGTVFPQDYGLSLRSLLVNGDEPYGFDYTGTVLPWFSTPLGEQGDIYLSGGLSAEYAAEELKPVFELFRFEMAYRFGSGLRLEAGRLSYREPLDLVCSGLFDGFALGFDTGKTRLSAGVFYTGLLYKKTAYIILSPGDYEDYHDKDHYFASRRLVFSLDWEIPLSGDRGAKLDLGIIGQADLNEPEDQIRGDAKIHFQYALAKFTLPFLQGFNAELGTLLGLIEEEEPGFCFALSADLAWLPPGGASDRLSLGMALSSGTGDATKAFLPVNTIAQGKVLRPRLSGLALVEGGYTVRLHPVLSADFQGAYFFRTDSRTYNDPELDGTSLSPLLGGEMYGGLTWVPVSDIAFTLGSGIFFPRLGQAFEEDASPRWRISLETILSF